MVTMGFRMPRAEQASERLVVLMTPTDKTKLETAAAGAGMSVAEFVRRAVTAYDPDEAAEIQKLRDLTEELRLAADTLENSFDEAMASYAAMRKQLDARRAG